MKEIAIVALFCAIPISCFAGATYLAARGADGWGWMIFAGLLIACSIRYQSG